MGKLHFQPISSQNLVEPAQESTIAASAKVNAKINEQMQDLAGLIGID